MRELLLATTLMAFSPAVAQTCGAGNFTVSNGSSASTSTTNTTSPPPPAAAVGYDTETSFGPNITLNQSWLLDTQNGTTANVTQNSDGSVTIAGGGDTWNAQLETYVNGKGEAFGGGFYAQATITVPGPTGGLSTWTGGSSGSEWPSWWANSVNGSIETDFMEMMGTTGQYGATVHNWTTNPQTGYGQNIVAPNGNTLHGPNTFGFLWVPATATTSGSMTFYLNGQPVGQPITWTRADPGPYGIIDGQQMVLRLGAGANSPMTVSDVEVWQASTADDSINGSPVPGTPAPTAIATPSPNSAPASGVFTASAAGTIIGPNGLPWIGRGIDINDTDMASVQANVATKFAGVTLIRLAAFSYQPPSYYAGFISWATGQGIVVQIADYQNFNADGSSAGNIGAGSGVVLTGAPLARELSWLSALAKANAGNPLVWFEVDNEPPNGPGLGQWEQQQYQAVRSGGNTAPFAFAAWGGGVPGQIGMAGAFVGDTNILFDIHFYGWPSNYSTDQGVVTTTLAGMVSEAQEVAGTSIPVIVGEYGNSTSANGALDPNWPQVVAAVINAASGGPKGNPAVAGASVWAWNGIGGEADEVLNPPITGDYTQMGNYVALFVNSASACSPATPSSPIAVSVNTPPPQTEPPDQPAIDATVAAAAASIAEAQQELSAADAQIQQAEAANAANQPSLSPAQTAVLTAQANAILQSVQAAMRGVQ